MNWIARHRRLVLAFVCVFWTGAALLCLAFSEFPFLSALTRGEQGFQDFLRRDGRKTATRADMVFVGIDETTVQFTPFNPEDLQGNRAMQLLTEHGPPFSRELWAVLLDKLFAAGARMVMFDLIFGKPGQGDEQFRAALDRYGDKIILGVNFDFIGTATAIFPTAELLPSPTNDPRAGYTIFFNDGLDGKVRSVRYQISERQLAHLPAAPGDEIFTSLSGRAVQNLGHAAMLDPLPLEAHLLRFSRNDAYPSHSLSDLIDPEIWRANYGNGAFFKDKIIIIGAASQVAHDVVDTPLTPALPGPVLHLQALAAALSGEFLTLTPVPFWYVLICGAGLLAWLLVGLQRRPLVSLISVSAVTILYLAASRILYDRVGLLLLTVPVLVTFVGSGASSLGLDYVLERREKLKTRRTLERYVSKDLVKEILDNPASFLSTMKGARVPVTVLFSDLIGFTTLSERADPEELVRHLNEYLSKMVEVVFANNGTLDKFIGDAIMAVWGNVQRGGPAADAKACAHAALGMRKALKELNAGWRQQNRMNLGMGVGINHGEAIAGNIGSGDRADLTVIGDAVNLASRLEALTRNYGVDILVGDAAADLIRGDFYLRSVARVQVKGKTVPVGVSTLLCAKGDEFDAELLKWLESYEEGIVKFRGRGFSEAKILFQRFLEFYPQDYLAKMYLDRAVEYELEPPDELWNAAEIFTKK